MPLPYIASGIAAANPTVDDLAMCPPPISPISPLASDGVVTPTCSLPAPLPLPATIASSPPAHVRRKLRVLILSSDTGGGHRASAQALLAALQELYPTQVHVDIVDFWVEMAGGPFADFPAQYTFLAKRPWMWKLSYEFTRFPPGRGVTETFFNAFGHRRVRDAFVKYAPDLIVSVHPLVNTLSQKVLGEMRETTGLPTVPYVTVVTDLGGAHPTWFHNEVDMTYIPSDGVRTVAKRVGLPDDKLRKLGLPVRKDFWYASRDKETLRAELGMEPNAPAVLVVGGGDGVGGLKAIAEKLATDLADCLGPGNVQVVVICGKNEKLRSWLASKTWPVKLIPLGYVNNMSDWMGACDIICTKAGPGTIAEALIRGLPTIITGFLPGQEEANVKYVVSERVGEFAQNPSEIAAIASRWLGDPETLAAMSERALCIGRPMASLEIAGDVIEVARAKIAENVSILERQRQLRRASGHDTIGPHAQRLLASSPESHLLFRIRFLLRVVVGSMIARKALTHDGDESCTPPTSPMDSPSYRSDESSAV